MASEYVYHWNRIFGALALLVVLLGALAYGVASLFGSEDELRELAQPDSPPTAGASDAQASAPLMPEPALPAAGDGSEVATSPVSPSSAGSGQESMPGKGSDWESKSGADRTQVFAPAPESDPPVPVEEDFPGIAEPLEIAETVAGSVELGTPDTAAPALEAPTDDPAEEASKPASLPTAAVPTSDQDLSPGSAAPLLAAVPLPDRGSAPDRNTGQAPASAQQPDPAQSATRAVFGAGETRLFSPAVQRFSLATGVRNREPVGDLKALSFNENGLATAYAFSEVEGLMGATLYYHWLHEGKKVAAVRIRVADNRWRSHSSKYIEAEKTGVWSVQLRNAEGALLAQADFSVRGEDSSTGQ
jgi:hypothetical protein